LSGGVTLSNTLNLQGTGNVFYGGTDFNGQLYSVTGSNTYSGPISFSFDAAIGVAAGSTLNITGGITNAGSQRYLSFNNEGTLNLSSPITPSGFAQLYAVDKRGAGTMNITTPQTFALDTANGQWFNIRGGSVVLSGGSLAATTSGIPTGSSGSAVVTLTVGQTVAGLGLRPGMFVANSVVPIRSVILSVDTATTFTLSAPLTGTPATAFKFLTGGTLAAPVLIDRGGSLVLDHRGITVTGADNITANGRLGTSATDDRQIVFRGGLFQVLGNNIVNDDLVEYLAEPLFRRGATTVDLRQNQSGTVRVVFNDAFSPVTPNQNTTTSGADTRGASVLFRGQNFGVNNAPGTTNVVFAGGASLNGSGGDNATNKGIFPWALIGRTDVVGESLGTSFATVTNGAGGGTALSGDRIVRALKASEYSTNLAISANNNMQLTDGVTRTVAANVNPGSLTISGSSNLVLSPGVRMGLVTGGILVRNGSNVSITGGVLDQANTLPGLSIWTVGTSQLTIGSSLTGGNGVSNARMSLVKAGAGTLVLNPVTAPVVGLAGLGTNSLSGQLVINEGTLKLATGVKNATQTNNFLALIGGTLDLNGNSQQILALFGDQAYANANGTIMSSVGTGHILINQDNAARNWAGLIIGDVKVTKQGQQTLNLYSGMTFTNSLLVNGGNVLLRDEGAMTGVSQVSLQYGGLYFDNATSSEDLTNRFNDAAPVTMRGGILELRGRAQTASAETVGAVTLDSGQNSLNVSAGGTGLNSADLNLTSLSRPVGGGTVNFTGASGQAGNAARITIGTLNGVSTATVGGGLTNGIIGGWAVIGTSDFASYIPGLGVGALGANGFPAYSPAVVVSNSTLATDNIKLNTTASSITADVTVNSLATSNVAVGTVGIGAGRTLTVGSGGVLSFTDTAWFIGSVVNQGTLTSGTSELFLYAQGTNGIMTVRPVIADRGANPVGLTKFGANTVALEGLNTYTGGTTVNQGTLTVRTGSRIPLAAVPTKGLILNNVTFTQSFAGTVDAGNVVTLNAGSTVNYFGNNTQAGLVFNNLGGTGTPLVRTFNNAAPANRAGSEGVLTIGNAGIVATSANVGTTATIEGRLDFGTTAKTINVAAIDVNDVSDVSPLQPSLILQGIVGKSGGITKTGNGVLQLTSKANFTGAFNVNAGGIRNGLTYA
ncbi:MAG: beta strand repeat-containing protein, partial [Opitutia bacterium]